MELRSLAVGLYLLTIAISILLIDLPTYAEPNAPSRLDSTNRDLPTQSKTVEIKSLGVEPGKPPLRVLRFDITLRNRDRNQRWFIFPGSIHQKRLNPNLERIEIFEAVAYQGQGQAIVANLRSNHSASFYALLLPAGAKIKLRNFKISDWGADYWGQHQQPLPIQFFTTSNLTIAGKPAAEYLNRSLISSIKADVDVSVRNRVINPNSKKTQEFDYDIVLARQ